MAAPKTKRSRAKPLVPGLITGRGSSAQLARLDEQIIAAVTSSDIALTLRQVFYQMVTPTLDVYVVKDEKGYNRIQRRLDQLREAGRVSWDAIIDGTRAAFHHAGFGGAGEFLRRYQGIYRSSVWDNSDIHCELWVESRGLGFQLKAVAERWGVTLYPSNGFSSKTFLHGAAEDFAQAAANGKKRAVILQVGDYDPSGLVIPEKIEEDIRRYMRQMLDGWDMGLSLQRLAVTEEQIESMNLPTKPRKETEKIKPEIEMTVEVEAMPALTLRQIVADALDALLPARELAALRAAETSEKEGLWSISRYIDREGGAQALVQQLDGITEYGSVSIEDSLDYLLNR